MKKSLICIAIFAVIVYIYPKTSLAQGIQEGNNLSQSNGKSSFDSIPEIIIDSDLQLDDALSGQTIPEVITKKLELVTVYYYGFDDKLHKGQLLVHKSVVKDIIEIFDFIRRTRFPVAKVIPISEYKWSDEKSMKDNNTSSFNYRFISGTRVHSMHASGLAIDINPLQNPYIKNHIILPEGASYNTTKKGTLSPDSPLVKEFKKRGWTWGGDWKSLKDYQHFEKKMKN
jgi:hypothetical protein